MSSRSIEMKCPKCGALVRINISYGVYPCKTRETAECPVCDTELYHENITGDMDVTLLKRGDE